MRVLINLFIYNPCTMKPIRFFVFLAVLISGVIALTFNSCSKDTSPTGVPVVTTKNVYDVTNSSAIIRGVVTDNGGASVTERGVCYDTSAHSSIVDNSVSSGNGIGAFECEIKELNQTTKYFYKVFALNSEGIGYGEEKTFTTHGIGGSGCEDITSVTYQGQTYNTVEIGDQCWLKENLNYAIGNSWCYDNDPANCISHGRLYDWGTIMKGAISSNSVPSGVQGICPPGWHIPSDAEWKILEGTVDSEYGVGDPEWDNTNWRGYDAGEKLKSISGWDNGGGGTNTSGFTALPGGDGYIGSTGNFHFRGLGYMAKFWTSTEFSSTDSWQRLLYSDQNRVIRYFHYKEAGMSARCLKDY